MGITKNLSRLGALLAGLGVIAVTFAATASASAGMIPAPGDIGGVSDAGGTPVVRTVVVGGMPGWQIALIAIVAALVAAVTAVLLDRARSARRQLASTPA